MAAPKKSTPTSKRVTEPPGPVPYTGPGKKTVTKKK
jgi:hypothetical protein